MRNFCQNNVKEKISLGYKLVKAYFRLMINGLYYRRYYSVDVDNIPADGTPLVVVSDHQFCLNDALGVLLAVNDRKMRFIARADAFTINPFFTKFILWVGLRPAFRMMHQGEEQLGRNQETFDLSEKDLLAGHAITLYPEAGHQTRHWLGFFSQGYLRMAFEAAAQENFQKEIFVLPSCNHYSKYNGLRNDMLVRFGKPISLKPYYELYKEKPRTAMREVNQLVRTAISSMMLDIQDLDNYPAIDFLRTNYGKTFAALSAKPYGKLPEKLTVEKDFVAALGNLEDQTRESVYAQAEGLRKGLEENKLTFKSLKKKVSSAATILKLIGMALLFPLWVFSLWPNFFNYQIPKKLTKRVKDKMLSSSFLLGVNAVITTPLFAIISFVLIWCFMTIYMALIYLLLMPPLTLFCWYYTEWWDTVKEELRLLAFHKKSKIAKLRTLRKDSEKLEDRLWSLFKI